ncbi:hypothetical protein [Frondihabitans australicus]|uniref:Uncharacterized protein n=1 Tax=Frondihabitans australicus TaxID=386892 RepID=A0A495IJB3_9MICO|nr:hypothetical protein [Frondihabitans australicus]RKR76057.1 hypothetical protein C8E83_3221 [Frondihabitans australicus]
MNRYYRWLDHLPLPAFFGFVFVFFTGVRLILAAADRDRFTASLVVIEVVGGLIFAGILTALVAWRRRRAGGRSTFADMNQALRTGRLPEDAEPSVWAPELERRRRSVVASRIWGPIFFGIVGVLGVAALVSGQGVVLSLLLIALCVGFIVFTFVAGHRSLVKIDSLKRQLDPRDA